ncbi:uncharacterized mitochondrial protein AtMg00810-like [Nicotiana tomentosiformis]|uniref:uncharacterized mitochondrial protein AtMg00810-like n=1 Tax=Nicotiana tomentosiformis TaxID=4098 RepID=UPI00388C9E87
MVTVRTVISVAASKGWHLFQMDVNNAFLQGDLAEESAHDHSLFTKKHETDIVIILIYVDDLLITGNSKFFIEEAKSTLHKCFKVKDLGELRYFLRIEVMRSKEGVLLNQRKYALELISDAGLSGCKPVATPMELNHKLTTVNYDNHVDRTDDAQLEEVGAYQRLVGKLLYLTITRLDIYALQYRF